MPSWLNQSAIWIEQACLTEVLSPKPGNVSPAAEFSDSRVDDFVRSARAIAPILARAGQHGVGRSIHQAVLATRQAVGHNTNLGIVLLLAPLAAVRPSTSLHDGIGAVLDSLTVADADWTYRAIREADPGGLGDAAEQDIAASPTEPLVECMRYAADRDLIAQQYISRFHDVLVTGLRWLRESSHRVAEDDRISWTALRLLSEFGDTLIARKCGQGMSDTVRDEAARVLNAGWPHTDFGRRAWAELDAFLRADGHARNPGTTADMIAAIVFAGLHSGEYAVREELLAPYVRSRFM